METQMQLPIRQVLLYMLLSFLAGSAISYIVLSKSDHKQTVSETCPTCNYSDAPGFTHISAATAHELADRYVLECQPALTAVINRDSVLDARCIQFSLANLKKYIWDLESAVCGCDSFKNLGIRFYYGKYPDLTTAESRANPDLNTLDTQYSFLHTVFLVPTYQTSDGINQDFEPLDIVHCQVGEPRPPGSLMSLMNHGNLSPPPFPDPPGTPAPSPGMNY